MEYERLSNLVLLFQLIFILFPIASSILAQSPLNFQYNEEKIIESLNERYLFELPLRKIRAKHITCSCDKDTFFRLNQNGIGKIFFYAQGACVCKFAKIVAGCTLKIFNTKFQGWIDSKNIEGNNCITYCKFLIKSNRKGDWPDKKEEIILKDIYQQIIHSISNKRFCIEDISPTDIYK